MRRTFVYCFFVFNFWFVLFSFFCFLRIEKLKLNPFNNTPSEWKWYNAVNEIIELNLDENVNNTQNLQIHEDLDLIG